MSIAPFLIGLVIGLLVGALIGVCGIAALIVTNRPPGDGL